MNQRRLTICQEICQMSGDDQPLVSIIMNCLNGEKYLALAIDSIKAQTYQNWEIIFWDNASTDDSANIAKQCGEKLKYFKGDKTIPLYAARNKALEKCNGDFIAFLDCDDLWHPLKLEKQVECAKKFNAPLVYTGYRWIDQNGKQTAIVEVSDKIGNLLIDNLKQHRIGILTAMVNARFIREYGIQFDDSLNYCGDALFFYRIMARSTVVSLSFITSSYRLHQGSITNAMGAVNILKEQKYLFKVLLGSPEFSNVMRHDIESARFDVIWNRLILMLLIKGKFKSIRTILFSNFKPSKKRISILFFMLIPGDKVKKWIINKVLKRRALAA